jgi:long-chain acyl-CoA synthetase
MSMQPLDHSSVFGAFAATAFRFPDKIAVSFLGTHFSYGKLRELAELFAAALAASGLKKSDRIVMYIPNSAQFVVAWLGIQRLGAVAVPITPIYTSRDLEYIANDTAARAVICADRNYGYVKQSMAASGIERVVVTNLADLLPFWKRAFGFLADKVPSGKVEKAPFTGFMSAMISRSYPPAPEPNCAEGEIAR